MLLDKLKLNKQLVRSMTDAGYLSPKEIQVNTMSRIIGGQDIIAVGPEGCGKTTAYVLGVLMRLKFGVEEAPRALILVPDKEHVLSVIEKFELLNKNKTIRITGLYAGTGMETQLNALADGADIVVATPDRARAIYLKLRLNLNKIMMFIVDDAELIIKQGLQLPVVELARSIVKCQHLVFTEVLHDKLNMMISPFMNFPAVIEVTEMGEDSMETYPQLLYTVSNYRTKINLLNLLIKDAEVFNKAVVFVNTRLTAEKIFKSMQQYKEGEVAVYKPLFFDSAGFDDFDDFKHTGEARVLIVANEIQEYLELEGISFIIHFELPLEKETFIAHILNKNASDDLKTLAITFSTDIELSQVRKIEQAIGTKLPLADLPANLIIERDIKKNNGDDVKAVEKTKPASGSAFHEKKESNAKDYNYSSREKAKMKWKNK